MLDKPSPNRLFLSAMYYLCENSQNWTGSKIISETGDIFGWVKDVIMNSEDDESLFLVISILPYCWLPPFLTGIYQLPVSAIASSGPDRVVVFAEANNRIICQTVSWLELLGLVKPLWRQEGSDLTWDSDGGSTGTSPMPRPRKPGPTPLNAEAEIPKN